MPDALPEGWTSRRLSLGEVTLHLVEAGPEDGPLVVLLHGFPEFWYAWRRQIGALAAAGLRVAAPDQRGYGRSDKPAGVAAYRIDRLALDIVALTRALGRERASIVGHDWGGIVAWHLAAAHPERVERLAILNAPHPDVVGPYMRRHPSQILRSFYIGLFQIPGLPERLLAARDFRLLRQALRGSSRRDAFTREDLARYAEAWAEPGALTGMLNWYRALVRPDRPRTGRVRTETLMIWGRRDSALEPGLAEASHAECEQPAQGVLWLDRATHWVQHKEAEAVNAALIAFLGRVPQGA